MKSPISLMENSSTFQWLRLSSNPRTGSLGLTIPSGLPSATVIFSCLGVSLAPGVGALSGPGQGRPTLYRGRAQKAGVSLAPGWSPQWEGGPTQTSELGVLVEKWGCLFSENYSQMVSLALDRQLRQLEHHPDMQGWGFEPPSGHIWESTNEYMTRWSNMPMPLSL